MYWGIHRYPIRLFVLFRRCFEPSNISTCLVVKTLQTTIKVFLPRGLVFSKSDGDLRANGGRRRPLLSRLLQVSAGSFVCLKPVLGEETESHAVMGGVKGMVVGLPRVFIPLSVAAEASVIGGSLDTLWKNASDGVIRR